MKILHLSDTHGRHHQLDPLPAADVIVHSGDITDNGTGDEIIDFIEWFESLDYTYKLFIPGNHDLELYDAHIDGLMENMFCLMNESVTLEGIKFYGLPFFTEYIRQGVYTRLINQIPSDTDVLVSHEAPLGILDGVTDSELSEGNFELLNKVYEVKPKLHLFGHAHKCEGIELIDGITFSNAALGRHSKPKVMHVFEV